VLIFLRKVKLLKTVTDLASKIAEKAEVLTEQQAPVEK